MNKSLETKAFEIAQKAHRGVLDKANEPYFDHVKRVCKRCRGEDERVVALLHDVIEDTPITLEDLREEGFTELQVSAVQALSHASHDNYQEAIARAGQHPIALWVKLSDLADNSNLERFVSVADGPQNKGYRALTSLPANGKKVESQDKTVSEDGPKPRSGVTDRDVKRCVKYLNAMDYLVYLALPIDEARAQEYSDLALERRQKLTALWAELELS